MKVNERAWQRALNLRGYFASEYLKYHGPTDSEAGAFLVSKASEYGYTDRVRAVPGSTLRCWMSSQNAPQWAIKTMIRYVLYKGFIPENEDVLDAILVYLLIDVQPVNFKSFFEQTELNKFDELELELSIKRIWHAKFTPFE